MLKKLRAQSTAEYAIILGVVIGAAVAMQLYVKRGLQAKISDGTDAFTGIEATLTPSDAAATTGGSVVLGTTSQYEPYYIESSNERFQENIEQEHMGSGKIVKEKVSDISATKAGGFQAQVDTTDMTTRDARWQ